MIDTIWDAPVLEAWLDAALVFANSPGMSDESTDVLFRFSPVWHPPKGGYRKLRREWRKCLEAPEDFAPFRDFCVRNSKGLPPRGRFEKAAWSGDPSVAAPAPGRILTLIHRPEFVLAQVAGMLLADEALFKVRKCALPVHGGTGFFFSISWAGKGKGRPPKYCQECIKEKNRPSDDN